MQVAHRSEMVLYVALRAWLVLLNILIARSIHVPADDKGFAFCISLPHRDAGGTHCREHSVTIPWLPVGQGFVRCGPQIQASPGCLVDVPVPAYKIHFRRPTPNLLNQDVRVWPYDLWFNQPSR